VTAPPQAALSRRWPPWLAWGFRVALGVIFIVAALPKVARPDQFAWSIAHYHLLPDRWINLTAIVLPWIELLCGAMLVLGLAIRANLLLIVGMLAVFIAAIASAMVRNLDISCGCFAPGPEAASITRWTLYWDIIWLLMGVAALIWDRERLSLAALWARGTRPRRGHA
jgi:uncharacterized membrane protein YphA (DoxX/SURF4 family)